MSRTRVLCYAVTLDGYSAGPHQSLENPLGVGGVDMMGWFFPTRFWRAMQGQEGGESLFRDLDLKALGYAVDRTVAGERATHLLLKRT